jgi:hypothetical protein
MPSCRARTACPLRLVFASLAVAGLSSCGGANDPKLNPTRGKVLYRGSPPAGALVVFHPADDQSVTAVRPSAEVADDGTFELTTHKPRDGAPAGRYVVTLVWEKAPRAAADPKKLTGMGGGEAKGGTNRLPPRYARPDSSPVRREVREGPNDLETIQIP